MGSKIAPLVVGLALILAVPTMADWDPEQPYKWVQYPDLSTTGIDVNATQDYILADDFLCTVTGPITDIHIWGSWLDDYIPYGEWPEGVTFTLSIHKDIPAEQSPTGFSMPGDVLWVRTFQPGDFVARVWQGNIEEGWLNPPGEYWFPADFTCWQYNFHIDATEAFLQEGTTSEPIVYWLDVQAVPEDPYTLFGWKTSLDHWNDDAVWGLGAEPYTGPWEELIYPPNHEMAGDSIDLAFVIAGEGPQTDYLFEFSLDIGSDIELSDPNVNFNEAADPGDVYWWQSAPIVPPGRDGFKDDLTIFGMDPWPDPPDGTVPPTTRVPVGTGSIEDYYEYFDLDGHDQTDFTLIEIEFPVYMTPSNCVYKPDYLMVSYDDDMAPGWPANDVPVTRPSPAGVSSYGATATQDEIVGVNATVLVGPPPYLIQNMYPIADEITVHQSLFPNPDNAEEEDDDVDSLDIVPNEDECPYWFFSPDHEAHLTLDPGGIYEVTAAGPTQVIDEAFHFGIPEDTDVDAFEFAWVEMPDVPGTLYLAVLYSVDEDDPLTMLTDESGGMNPSTIYVSWMTGFSRIFLQPQLQDDIDALTCWRESLEERGACCLPNGTCANGMTLNDCDMNQGIWFGSTLCSDIDCCFTECPGDVNGDDIINGEDIQCFVDCLINGSMPFADCNCACADMEPRDGVVDYNDVVPFVDKLLNATGPC